MNIRPHHLIDILAEINAGNSLPEQGIGNSLVIVAEEIYQNIDNPDYRICLVLENDAICEGCQKLVEGKCVDVLAQLESKPSKQDYNDKLDVKIFRILELGVGQCFFLEDFIRLIQSKAQDLLEVVVHPLEDGQNKTRFLCS